MCYRHQSIITLISYHNIKQKSIVILKNLHFTHYFFGIFDVRCKRTGLFDLLFTNFALSGAFYAVCRNYEAPDKIKKDAKGILFNILVVLRLKLFLNLRALTNSVAEIVKLSASNLTASDNFNLFNVRRMYGESLLYANAVRNTSYSEGLGDSAAVLGNDSALEKLNSLSVTLFDLVVNTNSITNIQFGYVFL